MTKLLATAAFAAFAVALPGMALAKPVRNAVAAGKLLRCQPMGKDALILRFSLAKNTVRARFSDEEGDGDVDKFTRLGKTLVQFGVNGGFVFDTAGNGTLLYDGEDIRCTVEGK